MRVLFAAFVALIATLYGTYRLGQAAGFTQGFGAALVVDSVLRRAEALNRAADSVEREIRAFRGLPGEARKRVAAVPRSPP